MNYNSYSFWLLFAIVLAAYRHLPHRRQNHLLLVASYVFYGLWDYRFLYLILLSTSIDYVGGLGVAGVPLSLRQRLRLGGLLVIASILLCTGIDYGGVMTALRQLDRAALQSALPRRSGLLDIPLVTALASAAYFLLLPRLYALHEERRRNVFLAISMIANLSILGFFKYWDFFVISFADLLSGIGIPATVSTLDLILPAGISFYTFQAMSYTIDIYRRETEPTRSFADFALFVCFFPHLVAGPIMRATALLPQITQPRQLKPGAWEEGTYLVILGLFKKAVIADNLAPIVNAVFFRIERGEIEGLGSLDVLVAVYAFAFQIYGDFSGYSSIARGISKWLGFELAINFHQPYWAVSPSDFWRRWHISLSSWLRDYLYVPLGGNRGGAARTYRNLLLTMLLGGLWHGANWTFVAWGLYHGGILCVFRAFGVSDRLPTRTIAQRIRWCVQVVVMFHLTCIGWIFFRAETLGGAVSVLEHCTTSLTATPLTVPAALLVMFYVIPLLWIEMQTDGENHLERFLAASWVRQTLIYVYLVVMLLILRAEKTHEFIYFQF